jgi:ABC-type multidrug transport system fused ATPase/permease subunit
MHKIILNLFSKYPNVFDNYFKIKLAIYAILQILINVLDLMAIAILGIFVNKLFNKEYKFDSQSNVLNQFNDILQISDISELIIIVLTLLIGKSILSLILTKKTLYFLSTKSTEISTTLFKNIFKNNMLQNSKNTHLKTTLILTRGINSLITGMIGNTIILLADLSLLLILLTLILIASPLSGLMIVIFSIVSGFGYAILTSKKSAKYGRENFELSVLNNEQINTALRLHREIELRGASLSYTELFKETRMKINKTILNINILPLISKNILEVGFLIIMAISILMGQKLGFFVANNYGILAATLLAGFRIIPALLRIQNLILQMRVNTKSAQSVFEV